MSYTDAQVSAATSAIGKYRGSELGEIGAALAVVGLSAERAAKEAQLRDDMIRVAHRVGASLRQLAEVSGLDRKTVTAIVNASVAPSADRPSGVCREQPMACPVVGESVLTIFSVKAYLEVRGRRSSSC